MQSHDIARVQDELVTARSRLAQTELVLAVRDEQGVRDLLKNLAVDRNADVPLGTSPKELLRNRRFVDDFGGAITKLVREIRRPRGAPGKKKREAAEAAESLNGGAKRDVGVRAVGGG